MQTAKKAAASIWIFPKKSTFFQNIKIIDKKKLLNTFKILREKPPLIYHPYILKNYLLLWKNKTNNFLIIFLCVFSYMTTKKYYEKNN